MWFQWELEQKYMALVLTVLCKHHTDDNEGLLVFSTYSQ